MASEDGANRPLASLILLGIVDFVCILMAAESYRDGKFFAAIVWLVAGIASAVIGYYWPQIKLKVGSGVSPFTTIGSIVPVWKNDTAPVREGVSVGITGEIVHARRPMRISPYKGHEQSMLLLKLRVSTRAESATIRRANLTVESNGKKYEGKKQPVEIEPVTFHYQFTRSQEEQPFDLVDRVAKEPLRRAIGTEGWLQFLVDGLPDGVGVADLYLTITDDLGGEQLISAKSFSID